MLHVSAWMVLTLFLLSTSGHIHWYLLPILPHRTPSKVRPSNCFWDSPRVHQVLCPECGSRCLSNSQTLNSHTVCHKFVSSMDIGWTPCASMRVVKRASLPCRVAPFPEPSEMNSWRIFIRSFSFLVIGALAPVISFPPWSQYSLSQQALALGRLSSPSTMLAYV